MTAKSKVDKFFACEYLGKGSPVSNHGSKLAQHSFARPKTSQRQPGDASLYASIPLKSVTPAHGAHKRDASNNSQVSGTSHQTPRSVLVAKRSIDSGTKVVLSQTLNSSKIKNVKQHNPLTKTLKPKKANLFASRPVTLQQNYLSATPKAKIELGVKGAYQRSPGLRMSIPSSFPFTSAVSPSNRQYQSVMQHRNHGTSLMETSKVTTAPGPNLGDIAPLSRSTTEPGADEPVPIPHVT